MILRHLFASLLFVVALPAIAAPTAAPVPTPQNSSVEQFLAYHDEVARRASSREMDALSRTDRDALAAAQAEIRAMLAGKASIDELDAAGKVALFNANEKVIALVNKAEDERLVCKQTKRLGSHRHTLECRTVAQIRTDREAARDQGTRTRACDPARGSCGGG
jgi:hypothetical protein